MKNQYLFISIFFSLLLFCGCSKENPTPELPVSIPGFTSFDVYAGSTKIGGDIDVETKTITLNVPANVNIASLRVEAQFDKGAILDPESGYSYNFTNPIDFTLSKDGQTVTYKVMAAPDPLLLSASLPDYYRKGAVVDSILSFDVTYGTNRSSLKLDFSIPVGCTALPASGTIIDATQINRITISNSAGTSRKYRIDVNELPQEKQIRAVWVPDPSHTTVMHNYKNLQEFVALLDELHFNTIYLASWVRTQTIFKSQVLKNNTNYATVEDGYLFGRMVYDGPSGDPVRDLINLAHLKDIKVIFWFEYGFMRDGGANPPANHPILSVHPEWEGLNSEGKASNYNGTDYYLNSYDPNLQEFMLQLIEESIDLYPDVDGIQGDDRMPAAPRNSGYNEITKAKYKAENGVEPPSNYNDPTWVRWRLNELNLFGKQMYDRIKAKRESLIVCFSPNPYPWCEDNLMQDWPGWIKSGIVEILSVQCYRETVSAYQYTMRSASEYVKANTTKSIFNPGIYLRNTLGWEQVFVGQLLENRAVPTNGEAFFYNEGLKQQVNKRVLKAFYTGKALFPEL